GVIQLIVERPAISGDRSPTELPLTDFEDPAGFDAAVVVVRRLATRLPDVIAASAIDVDAGTVCADEACAGGQVLARLTIDAIGLDADVLGTSRTQTIEDGPGLAPGSVPIGSPGVVRVWGHRTTYGAPSFDLDLL